MAKAIGVGGVFFKAEDPDKLYEWYVEHLGVTKYDEPGVRFMTADQPQEGYLVWAAFGSDTSYFDPATRQYMFNLIVDDLEGALEQVSAGGAEIIGEIESYDYGRFGWFMDPEGNKVELWEPVNS
jgi:predicted enzyme related to lactoylglutathione lyase